MQAMKRATTWLKKVMNGLHAVCLLLVTYFDAFERLVLAEFLDCADLLHNIINEVTIIHGVLNYHSYQKKVFSCTVLVSQAIII